MKKKLLSVLLVISMAASVLLAGCGGQSADDYLGEQITAMKKDKTDPFSTLLDDQLAELSDVNMYALTFPDELKEPYLKFLQTAFNTVEFEVASADKKDNGNYKVQVTFTPLDIAKTTKEMNDAYTEAMQGTDLAEECSALLEKASDAVKKNPEYDVKTTTELEVKKKGDSYSVSDNEYEKLISASLISCMAPYDAVCNILNARDLLQAYLDASFKGEFTQYMKHTGKTEEEAQAWYEADGAFDPPSDLSAQYQERCSAAYKNILKQCNYSVGIPHKIDNLFNYTVDVTVTPNNSIKQAYEEFSARSFYSIEEASAAYVEIFEKYAASSAYGEETTMTVELSLSSILASQEAGSDLYKLGEAICPAPQ
ncbi:hypothetical protein [Extibacter muris]|uniref:hypothetical protein n=1 Tax=Extibacter muris TaxID=1796622 RepID=UPI001D0661DB|nr:hypothetical protein [Extibacter muris]MCB6203847.1 hypothetical protein [Extibacter muris]MCQ4665548.1 hypothetical protein [Extibacter muris]MCQ4694989.1 hypothetical protein [Extibacter muris]